MELITKAPKGTVDIVPGKSEKWQVVEDVFRSEAELNGFGEVRTPVFEHTELFQRGVGDTTDVVEKQMYTFEDKGGRSITLRPEGTAGAVRAMLENGLYNAGYPVKLYYLTSCYRYEKPQAGRLRELHQFGVEMFGAAEPVADAQIIAMALSAFKRLGLEDVGLQLNSIGCPECRKEYHKALEGVLHCPQGAAVRHLPLPAGAQPHAHSGLQKPRVPGGAARARRRSPTTCARTARPTLPEVQEFLTALGIEFEIDPGLVRGLDYYTRTVFEFPSKSLGFALGGGGRYDGLVEEFGGKPTPGLGFGLGLDRIMMALEAQQVEFPQLSKCEMYIATMGEEAQKKAFLLLGELHRCGIPADTDLCGRGLKAQMKYADKIGAKFTMVLGDNELQQGKAEMKNMKTGEKRKISISGEDFINDYVTVSTEAEDFSQDGIFF